MYKRHHAACKRNINTINSFKYVSLSHLRPTKYKVTTSYILNHSFCISVVAKIITDGRYGTGTSGLYISTPYCSHTYTNIRYCSIYNYGYSQCSTYGCQYNRLGLKCYGMNDIFSNIDVFVILMLFTVNFKVHCKIDM